MSALTLVDIAAEINHEHQHALDAAHSAVRRARRAGELLLEAKERCEHGEWLPWLKANCPRVSERTAQAYMRVARKCLGDEGKAEQLELLTLGEALEQLVDQKATLATDIKSAAVADLSLWAGSAPPEIPMVSGCVTIGYVAGVAVYVLLESREYPGFWHDIDLRQSHFSTRPIRPLGVMFRLGEAACEWSTHPDDGSLVAVVGEHLTREEFDALKRAAALKRLIRSFGKPVQGADCEVSL